jgi:exonuclease III
LAFLVHQSVTYSPVNTSAVIGSHTECQAIKVSLNNSDLTIFNIYVPLVSSCPTGYKLDLDPVFRHSDGDVLVCGDVNAHHEGWDSSLTDPRG